MKPKILRLFLAAVFIAGPTFAHARGADGPLSKGTFTDEGNQATPFKILVGTQTPVIQPYPVDVKNTRAILFQNPSATYALEISTWALFKDADAWFFVNPSSGTLSLSNNTTFWFKYGDGSSSNTVRGVLLQQLAN